MKTLNLYLYICLILIASSISSTAQLTKFQKWQQPSYFTGFNMSVWDNNDSREVNQQDFDSLKAIGATLVIIQTQGSLNVESPYAANIYWTEGSDTIFHIDMLDLMVSFAGNAGLMYVIAVRDGPGRYDVSNETGISTIWTNPAEQQLYGKMLKDIAKRYLPDTLFVGMDLTVEPNPMGELWEPPIAELDSALTANGIDINALYTLWIDSVRTVDTELPLIVEGVHASHPEYFSLVNKQADNKIVYNTHIYNPAEYSHADSPNSLTYPGNYWCVRLENLVYFDKTFMKDSLYKPVMDFQEQYNVPILIGEFGLRYPQAGGDLYLSDIANIACESGWHYALWGFNNGPEFNYKDMDSIYGTNYWDMVKAFMNCGLTAIEEKRYIPKPEDFVSLQSYPNPFSESTTIYFNLRNIENVTLKVFDVLGNLITTLVNEELYAGEHSVVFDSQSLPSGVYFLKFTSKYSIEVIKLMKLN